MALAGSGQFVMCRLVVEEPTLKADAAVGGQRAPAHARWWDRWRLLSPASS